MHETLIRSGNGSLLLHIDEGLLQGHALGPHEEGDDEGDAPALAPDAVHEDDAALCERRGHPVDDAVHVHPQPRLALVLQRHTPRLQRDAVRRRGLHGLELHAEAVGDAEGNESGDVGCGPKIGDVKGGDDLRGLWRKGLSSR